MTICKMLEPQLVYIFQILIIINLVPMVLFFNYDLMILKKQNKTKMET